MTGRAEMTLCDACAEEGQVASLRSLAGLSERQDVRRSREIVAVVDDWTLSWEGVCIVLTGVERGSEPGAGRGTGTPVREPVVSVDYRPTSRAYSARGWLGLGKLRGPDEFQHHVLEWGHEADRFRDSLLGRGSR